MKCSGNCTPVIIKIFRSIEDENKILNDIGINCCNTFDSSKYYLAYETIEYIDKTTNKVAVQLSNTESCIIVIKYAMVYTRVFMPEFATEERSWREPYAIIDVSGLYNNEELFFDNFPLHISNDMLYPTDTVKNFQCWIDNGFFFPIMKRTHKKSEFNYPASYWNIGIKGLLGVFSFQLKCKNNDLNE